MGRKKSLFHQFFQSEQSGGFVLIACTLISLLVSNSAAGGSYLHFWHQSIDLSFAGLHLDHSLEAWINDGLMAVFFLLVGLEIRRELVAGELSSLRQALLPIAAAIGGMALPALIHFAWNAGTETQAGLGIPMATDIAFALGVLSLAGRRVPLSLRVFLTALAIIDDLGAITVIAVFYTQGFSFAWFLGSLAVFLFLLLAGRRGWKLSLVYLVGGLVLWYCLLQSGIHATIAGVLLAFTLPLDLRDERNLAFRVQHALHLPVAFLILPLFALANTAIIFPDRLAESLGSNNSLGILLGLVVGKCLGISLAALAAVRLGLARLAEDLTWAHVVGASLLGGIGFTMSIFITNLAFVDAGLIVASKTSILLASLVAALLGLVVLRSLGSRQKPAA